MAEAEDHHKCYCMVKGVTAVSSPSREFIATVSCVGRCASSVELLAAQTVFGPKRWPCQTVTPTAVDHAGPIIQACVTYPNMGGFITGCDLL